MNREIKIYFEDGDMRVFSAGSTPMEILKETGKTPVPYPMIALINHEIAALDQPIWYDSNLHYVGYEQELGRRTYVRTLVLLIAKAVEDLGLPRGREVTFEHAISNGYYCVWNGTGGQFNPEGHEEDVAKLRARVDQLIAAKLPIKDKLLPSDEAIKYFREAGRMTTAELIEQQGRWFYPCKELDGYLDFQLEPLLPNTGDVWLYDLVPYEEGVLLRIPDPQKPTELLPLIEQPKLFGAFKRHIDLLKMLDLEDVAPINRNNLSGKTKELIRISEAMQVRRVMQVAHEIAEKHKEGVRIILISGPSSSGKTTFSKQLQTQLITYLLKPFTLSLDNYFVNREQTPLDEDGEYDYESLYALDLPLLQIHINALIKGEEIKLPTYNFVTGEREYHGNTLQLAPDNILIIEGIHALNPALTKEIPREALFKVYISALTTVSLDTHNWIPTSDNRLLRRMVRDAQYRGTTASETIQRWTSVRSGEHKWVFPYQEEADVMVNSAMLYELGSLREEAEKVLSKVQEADPSYTEASRLLRLLKMFEPLPYDCVPPTSVLREFLGGSSFRY
ncbi:MAG: nucleoside kinase [Porphyromonas sp.]|nr:nucleoside kinase [Porphyromonas sp.]